MTDDAPGDEHRTVNEIHRTCLYCGELAEVTFSAWAMPRHICGNCGEVWVVNGQLQPVGSKQQRAAER